MSNIEYVMVMHDGNRSTKFMSEDYCKDLMEQLAAAQSQEVCTVAHDNVGTCGYCQRDTVTDLYRQVHKQLADALSVLQKHGIHVDETWCWCKPEVTDYSTDREIDGHG